MSTKCDTEWKLCRNLGEIYSVFDCCCFNIFLRNMLLLHHLDLEYYCITELLTIGMFVIFIVVAVTESPMSFAWCFIVQLDDHFGGWFDTFLNFIIKLAMILSIRKTKIHIVQKYRAWTTIQPMHCASNYVYLIHCSLCWISFRTLPSSDTIFISWTTQESLTMLMMDSNVGMYWLIVIELDCGCIDARCVVEKWRQKSKC